MGENNNRKKRIVAVNDTSFQLTLLRSILEKAGYDIACHESAEEALRSMTPENIPDLIITDLHMPGIDGWRFCRLLRSPEYSHLNQVPILANSATFGGEDTLSISSAAGADAFLESPYKVDDLLRFVQELISGEQPEKKPSLLIVEDVKTLANNLGRVLEQVGFDVSIAYDGATARKLFDTYRHETVILDQHLPDSTGLELLEAFETQSSKTVFIIVTGDEDPELAVKAMKNGASAFVRKPCSNDYLVELIRKAHREKSLMAVENLLEFRTRKLLEEEQRHKAAMDAAHEGFCISIDGILHYSNPAFADMLGKPLERIVHTDIYQYINAADRERIASIYQRYENGGHNLGLQVFSLKREDGKKCIVEASGSRIEYEGKDAVLCVVRDVTETQKLEREIDDQRRRYADMLSNMQIAVTLLDKDMRVLWANDFAKNEFPDCDPVGCFCYEHFENRESPVEDCPVVKCFETGKTQKREFYNPRNSKWYFSTAYPIKDEDGRVVQVMETAIDITERKGYEDRLALQALVLNQIEDRVTITDLQGRITYVNNSEVKALGYSREELLGRTTEVYGEDPEKGATQREIVEATIREGGWRGEVLNMTADGQEVIMDCRTQAVRNEHGDAIALCGIATDVTDRKRQEEILRLQRDLSVTLARANDLNETLRASLETSIQISGLDAGGIYLINEHDGSLTLSHHEGIPSALLEEMIFFDADSPQAQLVRKQKTRYASHREILSEIGSNPSESRIKALAIIPIIHEGKAVGCLNVGSFTDENISQQSRMILETIAGQIGAVIVRHWIFSELQVQRENLTTFFNTIHDFLFVMDENGTVIQTNNTVSDRLGYSLEEVVNKSVLAFHPEDRREEAGRIVEEMLAGKREICDIPLLAKDGELIPVETKVTRGRWNAQPAIFGISRDISERLRMEDELRESEEKYRTLVENSLQGVVIAQASPLRLSFANTAMRTLTGYDVQELLHMASEELISLIHVDDRERFIDSFQRRVSGENIPSIGEYRIVTKDSSIKWAQSHSSKIDFLGEPATLTTYIDITDKKRAEETVARINERQQSILAAIPDIVMEVDVNKVYTWANQPGLEFFGEDIIGKEASLYFEGEQHTYSIVSPLFSGNENTIYVESWQRRKDGEIRLLAWWCRVLKDEQGNALGAISTARDITDLKETENELRMMADMIDAAPNSITIHDTDGRFLYANRRTLEMHGYNDKEFPGINLHDLDVPESEALLNERFRLIDENGEASFEVAHYRKNGSCFPLEVYAKMVQWKNQPALLSIATDITDRKNAEEALRRSEEKYSTIVSMAPEAILICDDQGAITFANDQASALLDISQGNLLVGKSIFDFLPGEEAEKVIANQCLTLEGKDPGPGEYKAIRANGEMIDIEVHGEILRDVSGQFGGWLLMARDITAQKRLNEALEESQQRLNLALQVAHMGYWDWEVETNQVRWFGESAALFGTTPESFDETLNGVQTHVHPDDRDQGIEACRRCVEDDLPFDNTYRVVWPSGEIRWLHSLGKLFRDEQGKPVHVFGVTTDVTDRKMAENILIQREERFRKLIQNSNDILVILDETGKELYVSDSVERITGYTQEECIGKTGFDFLHPDDVNKIAEAFSQLVKTPKHTMQAEYRHRRKEGGWVYLEAIGTNWLDEQTIRGIVLNVRDVTERKQSEDEKDKLEQQLTQAMKMEAIGRLAGGVAHDFNNILTGISGNASMTMMDYASDPSLLETLKEISDASDRAAGLTRQLLAFSRKQILEPKVISLNRLIEDLMKMLVRLIGEDVSFTFSPKRRLGRVHADLGQIEQVVINLCVNARDAMPNGGKLTIETSDTELDESYCENHKYVTPGRYVLMVVSDTGTGMDEETRKHIFEPFFTTKPQGQGTGLGLATIYGIIKQHEGHIEVYSEPGKGTTFKVYLPSTRDAAESTSARDSISSMKTGTETVLLVEDEHLVRSVGVKILKRLGYAVLEAVSAEEARTISDDYESDIDLLMTDVVMPGENGRELARYIEKKRAGIKVLYTSGYTENAIAHHGVLDEGLNFIGKPFTPSELARMIRKVLEA